MLLSLLISVGCLEQTKLENTPVFDSGVSEYVEPLDESSEPLPKQLLSVDTNDGKIYEIDPNNASSTAISSVSMEYQVSTMDINDDGIAYVYDHVSQRIGILDPCTGELDLLPEVNEDYVICGISFANNGTLYALDSKDNQLLSYNLDTGTAIPVGPLEMDIGACGLAHDSDSDQLIGATASSGEIFTIDTETGATVNRTTTDVPFTGVGLEYDEINDTLLASTGTELYSVDLTDGSSMLLGSLGGYIDDLVYHSGCW